MSKNFKKNPAEMFMDIPNEPIKGQIHTDDLDDLNGVSLTPPPGHKLNRLFIETRSKRVQILVQPSVSERIKKLAERTGESMNELYNRAISEYLEREE